MNAEELLDELRRSGLTGEEEVRAIGTGEQSRHVLSVDCSPGEFVFLYLEPSDG